LRAFAGRDLEKVSPSEKEALDRLLAQLAPIPEEKAGYDSPRPWLLTQLDGDESGRAVLFCGRPGMMTPDASTGRLVVFDPDGSVVQDASFEAGWRIAITSAAAKHHEGRTVISVACTADIGGRELEREVFGVLATGEPVLLRLRESGHAARNAYAFPNHTIGPQFPKRSEEEWEAALASSDRFEILRTLGVLGGRHFLADDTDYGRAMRSVDHEPEDEAQLIRRVRARPGVRSALQDLARATDQWVAEAARLALSAHDER
jgi:hypothetical protein